MKTKTMNKHQQKLSLNNIRHDKRAASKKCVYQEGRWEKKTTMMMMEKLERERHTE